MVAEVKPNWDGISPRPVIAVTMVTRPNSAGDSSRARTTVKVVCRTSRVHCERSVTAALLPELAIQVLLGQDVAVWGFEEQVHLRRQAPK